MDVTVADNPAHERYEARTPEGDVAGYAEYERTGRLVVFTHTEVDPTFEGEGIGSQLAAGALDDVSARGLGVQVFCPFMRSYIERHPQYADLLRPAGPSASDRS